LKSYARLLFGFYPLGNTDYSNYGRGTCRRSDILGKDWTDQAWCCLHCKLGCLWKSRDPK